MTYRPSVTEAVTCPSPATAGTPAIAGDKTGRTLHVAGISAGNDGSGYHRMFQPFAYLSRNSRHQFSGPPQRPSPLPTREEITELGIDVLVMQRPVGPQSCRLWDTLKDTCSLVYECDDDVLQAEPSILPHLCEDRVTESIRYMLARADLVTVSTDYLAGEFARYTAAPVAVLPNVIAGDVLRMNRTRRDRLTIGWAGGHSHLADMLTVDGVLCDVLDGNPQCDMHFIGCDYGPLLRGRPYRWTAWADSVWDFYRNYDFDIALAPLADLPFNQSKSHLKVLDAFARGVPVVAADAEPYRGLVKDGVNGFLVSTRVAWRDAICGLITDESAREEMGRAAKAAASEWTIEGHWQEWQTAYETAAR